MSELHSTRKEGLDSPKGPVSSSSPAVVSLPAFRYSMMFALSEDLKSVLLLKKPVTHRNPLFRDRWTAPGGHIETGETSRESALREMEEETKLSIPSDDARFILRFACDCDPLEAEHEVVVFAATLSLTALKLARGGELEPVSLFPACCPPLTLWYIEPLLQLVIARMRQALRNDPKPRPQA